MIVLGCCSFPLKHQNIQVADFYQKCSSTHLVSLHIFLPVTEYLLKQRMINTSSCSSLSTSTPVLAASIYKAVYLSIFVWYTVSIMLGRIFVVCLVIYFWQEFNLTNY